MYKCPGCNEELEMSFKILNETFFYCLDCINEKCLLGAKSEHGFEGAYKIMEKWCSGGVSMNGLGGSGARPERP